RSNLLFSLCKYINNNFYGLTEINDKNIGFINNNAEAFISHLIKKPINQLKMYEQYIVLTCVY
ncbi:hypothetical protein ACWXVO_00650, partial [Mycoplasma sp. 1890]